MNLKTSNQSKSNTSNSTFKTGLFWRQSLWNGRKSVPIVMYLEGKTLKIMTHNDTLRIPLGILAAKFSRLGTMTLVAGSNKYDIVGSSDGNILSPSFTDEQLAELRNNNSWDGADRMLQRGIVSDLVITSDKNMPLMRRINSGGSKGIKVLEQWEAIFREAGVPVQAKKSIFYKYDAIYIGLVLAFLGGFIIWILQYIERMLIAAAG